MKKVLLSLLIMLTLCVRANHWIPDEYQYSNNMTLIGVIAFDDVEQRINEQSYSSLSLFPNPVNDKLIIEVETEIEEVGLYDLLGRLQNYKTARQYGYVIIDVSALNVGVYFARIKTYVGVVMKMFVKE